MFCPQNVEIDYQKIQSATVAEASWASRTFVTVLFDTGRTWPYYQA